MKRIGWLLCLYLVANIAFAVRVTALYQGIVPVASQSVEERNRMLEPALTQVLIKVSGNNQILNNPNLKSHLSSANTLMQEFSYSEAPHLAGETKPYLLHLNFDADGINKLLRDAGAPIWGQNRPLILIWLEEEAPGRKAEIIGADSSDNLSALLKQNTDRRGVPVIFPAMDMQDMSQIGVNDIATMDIAKLNNAAKRYGSDAILVGRIIQDTNGYTTQWKLVMGTDQWDWNMTGKTLADTFTAMTDNIATTLANRYAAVMTDNVQTKLTLKVMGISESDDFTQMIDYVKHLTAVTNAEVAHVAGSDVILDISLRGTEKSFIQAISIGQRLTPVASENNQTMLVYQWNH